VIWAPRSEIVPGGPGIWGRCGSDLGFRPCTGNRAPTTTATIPWTQRLKVPRVAGSIPAVNSGRDLHDGILVHSRATTSTSYIHRWRRSLPRRIFPAASGRSAASRTTSSVPAIGPPGSADRAGAEFLLELRARTQRRAQQGRRQEVTRPRQRPPGATTYAVENLDYARACNPAAPRERSRSRALSVTKASTVSKCRSRARRDRHAQPRSTDGSLDGAGVGRPPLARIP